MGITKPPRTTYRFLPYDLYATIIRGANIIAETLSGARGSR